MDLYCYLCKANNFQLEYYRSVAATLVSTVGLLLDLVRNLIYLAIL